MKIFKTIVSGIFFISILFSCQRENEVMVKNGYLQFTINKDTTKNYLNLNLTGELKIVVSIKDENGNFVCENSTVTLKKVGDVFQTDELPLIAGKYTLTKYFVADSSNKTLDVTPIDGSILSYLVKKQLPFEFHIGRNTKTVLNPELVNIETYEPQEFGYTSYKFKYGGDFTFLMQIYVYDDVNNDFDTISANVDIKSDSATFSTLISSNNYEIKLKDVPGKYVIKVTKEDYSDYVDTVVQEDLIKFFNRPYAIILNKSSEGQLFFNTIQSKKSKATIEISTNSFSKLRINWGDGSIDVIDNEKKTHTYVDTAIYRIQISGDIADINSISAIRCNIKSLNIKEAINIETIDLSRNPQLKYLDLSNLSKLKILKCVESELQALDLTNTDNLDSIFCSVNKLTSLDVSKKGNLRTLLCDRNLLTLLDVTNNPSLTKLTFSYNTVSNIDISKNPLLTYIDFKFNRISNFSIASNNNLVYIDVSKNYISAQVSSQLLIDLYASVKTNNRSGTLNVIPINNLNTENAIKDDLIATYKWKIQ